MLNTPYLYGDSHIIHPAALVLMFVLLCISSQFAWASPQLQSNTPVSTAGYFQLSWSNHSHDKMTLQQASSPSFSDAHTLYQGQDQASLISGLGDGDYYYRVGVHTPDNSEWSNTLHVQVEHHSLSKAFVFFILGAVMFVVTLTVLLVGNRHKS